MSYLAEKVAHALVDVCIWAAIFTAWCLALGWTVLQ